MGTGAEYLCQVNESISCGNCCGLYNVSDSSPDSIRKLLNYRSLLFSKTHRSMDAILAFKDHIREIEPGENPIRDFHHCAYLGLVGESFSRVGCLLHPLALGNKGIDFRGLSYYGGLTCNMYFCPSAHQLPAEYARIIKSLAENWYQYGLIITETALVKAFFGEAESRFRQPLSSTLVAGHPEMRKAVIDFFRLKIDWPFRPKGRTYRANYYFNDNIYPKPPVIYPFPGTHKSRYDFFFQELVSEFHSPEETESAESLLDNLFSNFIDL